MRVSRSRAAAAPDIPQFAGEKRPRAAAKPHRRPGRAEITRAQSQLQALTDQRPRFFRAPAGLRNPFLQPVLARHGLVLTSWTRRGFDTRERDPQRVLQRLTRGLAAGDILLLHDGHAARTPAGVPVVLDVLPRLLQRLDAAALRPVTLPRAVSTEAVAA